MLLAFFTAKIVYHLSGRLSSASNGDEGIRTPDLLRAREALSQLSYIPVRVGLTRLELVTFPLSEGCSNRLSYRPVTLMAERRQSTHWPSRARSSAICQQVP